jgi:vacuolar-type H+-ATPase subunit H
LDLSTLITQKSDGDTIMGDKFNLSGDFRGAVLNIKSTLTNVQQSIGEIPSADESTKQELESLVEALKQALEAAPAENQEEAQAVAESAKMLVETAKAEKPNRTMIEITGEGLKKAAQNLAEVMPSVVSIATQIVVAVMKITQKMP